MPILNDSLVTDDETKRLADVDEMKKTRFPRAGDYCTFLINVNVQPPVPVFDTVHVVSLSDDRTQITFMNDACAVRTCAVNDYRRKWWFADEDAETPAPAESSYDSSVFLGVARADKLKSVWDVLRTELEAASVSLCKAVGRVVFMELVKVQASDIPLSDSQGRPSAFYSSPYVPGQIFTGIRLRCPDLQYESHPLAYVRSNPEGLPFQFTYGYYMEIDSMSLCNMIVDSERGLQAQLQSVVKKLLSSVPTGVVVRSLLDKKPPSP